MSPAVWAVCLVWLTLQLSAGTLEIYEHNGREVICPQGLAGCTVEDVVPVVEEFSNAVEINHLKPNVKLCCNDSVALCTLCLVIHMEIEISKDEEHSGTGVADGNPKASVTACYKTPLFMPTCKKVEFTVNATHFNQQRHTKVLTVILRQLGFTFSSALTVYSSNTNEHLRKDVFVPSLSKVCHGEVKGLVENCYVPGFSTVINKDTNHLELKFNDSVKPLPSVCVQYEKNGVCQKWNKENISLHSVTPCMCFQSWFQDEEKPMRLLKCPFRRNADFETNLLKNVSVTGDYGQKIDHRTILLWNLSAPCRLEGEVWPCQKKDSCEEIKGFRQKLTKHSWIQYKQWVYQGVFEDIDFRLSPCVMVTTEKHKLGPFCIKNTDRWRWTLLVVGVSLLICLTSLVFYFLQVYIKECVWSWNHGGFVKIGRKGHVVLLSPPDLDAGVSELVSGLGSHLCSHGYSVSVDQWSRKEQCSLGPLPWLHSQLLKPNSRVVLILTRKALEKAKEWAKQTKQVVKTGEDDGDVPRVVSPYCDVFTASLCIMEGEKHRGRLGRRFILVNFESHPGSCKDLPKLLQGLPLFQLPSQTQPLLAELTVGAERTSDRRNWTWRVLNRWMTGTQTGPRETSLRKETTLLQLI